MDKEKINKKIIKVLDCRCRMEVWKGVDGFFRQMGKGKCTYVHLPFVSNYILEQWFSSSITSGYTFILGH